MRFEDIRKLPTTFKLYDGVDSGFKTHESLLRAYQIVQKVKEMLADGATPKIVLEMIEFMQTGEPSFLDPATFKEDKPQVLKLVVQPDDAQKDHGVLDYRFPHHDAPDHR